MSDWWREFLLPPSPISGIVVGVIIGAVALRLRGGRG